MIRRRSFLKGLVAAVPLGTAAVIAREKPVRRDPRSDPEAFRLDLERLHAVDPALVNYREEDPLARGVHGASALAMSPDGSLHVAVGSRVWRIAEGRMEAVIDGPGKVTAAALTDEGVLWTGAGQVLAAHDPSGRVVLEPIRLGERAYVTSLAVQDGKVYAADAGQKAVWIFDEGGTLKGRIDGPSGDRGKTGFVVPGPWFSLATAPGELWVANPGRQRIERYAGGRHTGSWGVASMSVEGFCGCCNPTHLALLPGGGFVTSEKGLPRVKVYSREGELLSVVAGPDAFKAGTTGLAAAAAPDGRILVLDPVRGQVRSFVLKAREAGHGSA